MPKILHPAGRLATVRNAAEKAEILRVLAEVGGDVERAYPLLGVSRRTLYQRIESLGLRVEAGGPIAKTP